MSHSSGKTNPLAIKLKRSQFFCVFLSDERVLDLQAFLIGDVRFSCEVRLRVFSVLTEETVLLGNDALLLLGRIPGDRWVSPADVAIAEDDLSKLESLVNNGLLLSTDDEPRASGLRKREERLAAVNWHPGAALYHFAAKQPQAIGIDDESAIIDIGTVVAHSEESFERFVALHGAPPPPFHRRAEVENPGSTVGLPLIKKSGDFYASLEGRRTARAFDPHRPMSLEDLTVILYYAFGAHGHARLSKEVSVIKRTSPSGGCLHPIEIYPLILNVSGLQSGFYHYDAYNHALTALSGEGAEDLSDLAIRMAGNQSFAGSAHALLFMTARFERNFWKYRNNVKTYGIILADSGHLSQTFYLVCSQLDLGAFYSAAINAPLVEKTLGLDGIAEGAIGVGGCGVRVAEGSEMGIVFAPFVPGMTIV